MTESLTPPSSFSERHRLLLVVLGPVIAGLAYIIGTLNQLDPAVNLTLGITLWCALWWITEPIPIPATSLLPLALFPLTGVLSAQQVASAYGHKLILLLMGGFMLSKAMEKSGTHRRIALQMIHLFGGDSGPRILAGFMVASALLSMWISNTATTLMLLPVALAILDKNHDPKLTTALLLGIAYSASIGGIGTVIGTPPNALFLSIYEETTKASLSFTDWMQWGVSAVILFIPIAWLWLKRGLSSNTHLEVPHPGQWRSEEKRVLTIFSITALLWITRTEPFGGWSGWLNLQQANDASVALTMVALLFMIPSGGGKKGTLLDWKTANQIPWGVLILFAGGICIASAFKESGLSLLLGEQLNVIASLPLFILIPLICLTVTFLTEVTSNTATTALLLPVLATTAITAGIDPLVLMVPAAMSASCAFMLPVATAPNAVIFGSEKITIKTMARQGFALNLIGALVISVVCLFWLS